MISRKSFAGRLLEVVHLIYIFFIFYFFPFSCSYSPEACFIRGKEEMTSIDVRHYNHLFSRFLRFLYIINNIHHFTLQNTKYGNIQDRPFITFSFCFPPLRTSSRSTTQSARSLTNGCTCGSLPLSKHHACLCSTEQFTSTRNAHHRTSTCS